MNIEIEKALADCRAAFAANPNAAHAWCCHHEILFEKLTEPAETRIKYILENKPESEHVVRFNNFRPMLDPEAIVTADDCWAKLSQLNVDYMAQREQLYADYEAKLSQLDIDCDAKLSQLYEDYWSKRAQLHADYNAKMSPRYTREVLLGTWNGKSVFTK